MKKKLSIALAVMLMAALLLPAAAFGRIIDPGPTYVTGSNSLVMHYYIGCGEGDHCPAGQYCSHGACGPASGVAIGWYYETRDGDGNGIPDYPLLPSPQAEMYDDLYDYMNTYFACATSPGDYGPGFVEMASQAGYDFSYDAYGYAPYGPVTYNTYWDIVNAIDNGWPVALEACFEDVNAISNNGALYHDYWPPGGGIFCGHYIVIRGYQWKAEITYRGTDYLYKRIICTDNWCGGDNLVLDWGELVYLAGDSIEVIIIKD